MVAAVPEEEFPREILNDVQVVINRHADAVPDEEFQQDVTEDVEVVSNREE